MSPRSFNVNPGLFRTVLGNLKVLLREGSIFKKELGAIELGSGKTETGHCLLIIGKSSRDISTLHPHQQLAFGYLISQTGVNLYHPARGKGNDRHALRYI